MKKGMWVVPLISLLLLNTSGVTLREEKSIWDDYTLINLEEKNERENPYQIEYVEETTIVEEAERIFLEPEDGKEGLSWMAEKVMEGSHALIVETYKYVYNQDGQLLSRTLVPDSTRYYESSEMIYEYGSVAKEGAAFSVNKITKYGADCSACYIDGNGYSLLASGIATQTASVRQSDGEWQSGITYDGYYILASSRNIPLCSVVEISGHSFSGMGLEPGEPFQAIVLDRGVKDGILDLFVGSEYKLEVVKQTSRSNDYFVEIITIGTLTTNSKGQRVCRVEEGPH